MNIPLITLKTTLLAFVLFWSILATDGLDIDVLPFVFLSLIPICIICLIANLFTVAPFFSFSRKDKSKHDVFSTFFPFYALIGASICIFLLVHANFEIYALSFFCSAYFTSLQSWIWFTFEKETHKKQVISDEIKS